MLRMLSNRVAVIPIEDPDETVGGIIIPKEAKRRSDQGIIKYRGDDVREVRIGDHVLFSAYSGQQVEIEDEGKFVILKEEDVVALLTDEPGRVLYAREQVERFLIKALQFQPMETDTEYVLECFRAQFDSYETVRAE